jgi:transcriptional regulator with XRE-family HTH domain
MMTTETEPMGPKIRRQRRRVGFSLDELAMKARISKPYLSLIENCRVANTPSDEKLRRLEEALSFASMELIQQAHLQRTPEDVRQMLAELWAVSPGAKLLPRSAPPAQAVALNGLVVVLNHCPSCPEVDDPKAYAARVGDESMTPEFRKGDIVIFSPSLIARTGDDCLVRLKDGRAAFQRIFFEEAEGGRRVTRLQPRNEKFRAAVVASKEIATAHRGVFKYQKVVGEI